ncbi:hypothetical protein FBUS_11575 [Fasciolopsis buskii]|uniref:Uncharacterized protein n=1 Tax=Fasciolopsis buskii TaxID=27845 RepID=A0A8E0RX65_9TREM|nr:hypothetical protein FBUS_11575 [Fasciolopsis buski]
MLGSLAFLRPLTFDSNGCGKYASISLPADPNKSQLQIDKTENTSSTQLDSSVVDRLTSEPIEINDNQTSACHAPENTDDCDSRVRLHDDDYVDAMSDDVDADLLLGLDTRQSRSSVNVGPLTAANGSQRRDNSGVGLGKRGQDKCVAFEETYNLWQEFMREEGMDMDMVDGNEDEDGLGAEALDASLDSTLDSILPGNSTRESMRTSDNGPGGMAAGMQHSEDPDIDAAIRSILSTTN